MSVASVISNGFRYSIGAVTIIGGFAALAGLYFIEVPEGNREPLLLAIGLVLGWGGTVVGYEFGSSPAGRQAAQAGLDTARDLAERTAKLADRQALKPQEVEVVNRPDDPVPVSPPKFTPPPGEAL